MALRPPFRAEDMEGLYRNMDACSSTPSLRKPKSKPSIPTERRKVLGDSLNSSTSSDAKAKWCAGNIPAYQHITAFGLQLALFRHKTARRTPAPGQDLADVIAALLQAICSLFFNVLGAALLPGPPPQSCQPEMPADLAVICRGSKEKGGGVPLEHSSRPGGGTAVPDASDGSPLQWTRSGGRTCRVKATLGCKLGMSRSCDVRLKLERQALYLPV